jgi:hypothetical protein
MRENGLSARLRHWSDVRAHVRFQAEVLAQVARGERGPIRMTSSVFGAGSDSMHEAHAENLVRSRHAAIAISYSLVGS